MTDNNRRLLMITKVTGIFVPVLIATAIIGIWFIKSNEVKAPSDPAKSFALEAPEVDLANWKSYKLPTIIAFGSNSCPACTEMQLWLKKLNSAFKGKAVIKFVDTSKNPGTAEDFPLEQTPAVFFFDRDDKPFVPDDAQAMQLTLYWSGSGKTHQYTAYQGAMTEAQFREILKEMGAG